VFYGWWLVGITGLIMVIATVPLFHAITVWAVALEREFGWSRAQLGFALTFTRVESGLVGPLEGYLTDKVGTRLMVFVGLVILGGAFLFFSQVDNLWMFYLAYVLMAFGQGLGSWIPLMTMLNKWFNRRRASAIGWSNVVSRLGALLLIPTIAWTVDDEPGRIGWRMTAMIVGITILVLAAPLSRLLRNNPDDYGSLPDGEPPPTDASVTSPSAPREQDLTASEALRTPAFWFISLGHGFTSMVILAIMTHLGLLLKDKGFDVQTTGWIVTVYTATAMIFQLVGGYVGDRGPKNIALFIFTTIQAAAVVVLTLSSTRLMFYLFAVLFGMGFGGRNPLTTAIRGEYFGRTSFGRILGLSTVPMNVLLLIGSPLAGYMRDHQGSYDTAFLLLAGLNFLGGVLFLFARKPTAKLE
jgi:sugar phosphate permease